MGRVSAPVVVAFWGLLNAALVATLAGFGEQVTVVIIYASAAALVEIIAAIVWLGVRREDTAHDGRRHPTATVCSSSSPVCSSWPWAWPSTGTWPSSRCCRSRS